MRKRAITADSGHTLHKLIILCAYSTHRAHWAKPRWDMVWPTSQAGKRRIYPSTSKNNPKKRSPILV